MDKFGIIWLILIGLLLILYGYGAINHENHLIKQSDNLEKICLKAYKTDLKNDREIKELCKDVKVKLFGK